MQDPIVEEVRAARRQLWKKAGGTLEGLVHYLRQKEQEHPERLADLSKLKSRRKSEEEIFAQEDWQAIRDKLKKGRLTSQG